MRIIFAGTPEFAVPALEKLVENHEIVAVYTQPDRRSGRGKKLTPSPVKKAAQEHSLAVFQPNTLVDQQPIIAGLKADVMVVVAYGMILPKAILNTPRLGCLNIHASLLPRWRGAAPIQRAIEALDEETGVSIMQMDEGLDTGPVFQMIHTPILDTDTSASLHRKLSELGAIGITQTLEQLEQDSSYGAQVQDDSFACYAKKLTKQEANINWQQSAESIDAKIRAFNPWPVCQTWHNEARLRIWGSEVVKDSPTAKGGTVLECQDGDLLVACGQQSLSLKLIQKDGSRPLPSSEFLNGYQIKVGDQLQSAAN